MKLFIISIVNQILRIGGKDVYQLANTGADPSGQSSSYADVPGATPVPNLERVTLKLKGHLTQAEFDTTALGKAGGIDGTKLKELDLKVCDLKSKASERAYTSRLAVNEGSFYSVEKTRATSDDDAPLNSMVSFRNRTFEGNEVCYITLSLPFNNVPVEVSI